MGDVVEEITKLFKTVETTVDIDESNLTPVQEFYNNTNILITGCTGFLGQVLLEKLLRSCPISKIFVVIRNKKGKEIESRLDEIFDCAIFQRIKNQFPERRKRVVPIEGDCTLPDIGLGDQDKKLLTDEVDIIFHVAATVRFDEKMKIAVNTNIRAPRDLLRLAHRMPRLKSFMHVSTAYGNCIHKVIEEDVYPPAANYEDMISMVDNLSDDILANITPRLVDKYPNTYTYTKQIAEDVVKQECQGLPVGIHRPSIVISTYKEPIRGWINNVYGATGIVMGAGVGLLRVCHCNPNYNANIIPVDMCVNSMITAAWDVSERFKEIEGDKLNFIPIVYNFESSNDKPINWEVFMDSTQKYGVIIPSLKCLWYYSLTLQPNYYLSRILMFLLHIVPAYIADAGLFCLGKSPMMVKAYQKVHRFSAVIAFFCTNEWKFNSRNVQRVVAKMTERDRGIFFSDLKNLDWEEFFKCYIMGAKAFILKDSIETLPQAKALYRKLYWAHQTVKAILGILLIWAAWSLTTFAINLLIR